MPRILIPFVFLLVLAACAAAEETVPQVKDTRESWQVGISVFTINGANRENDYLGSSLPRLLYDKLAEIREHAYSAPETAVYRTFLLEERKEELRKQIAKLNGEQDGLILVGKGAGERYEKLSGDIERLTSQLENLAAADPETIAVNPEKPVHFLFADNAALLPGPLISPLQLMKTNVLDFYIQGMLEEVEGYFYLEIQAGMAGFEEPVYMYRNASGKDTLDNLVTEAAEELRTVILGREWGRITVSVGTEAGGVPEAGGIFETGGIYVDAEFIGSGTEQTFILPAGAHELLVKAPGYADYTARFDLGYREEKVMPVVLTKGAGEYHFISTLPSGAEVYQASLWKGRTPLLLAGTGGQEQVLLNREGFAGAQITLDPASPLIVHPSLVPSFLDQKDLVMKKQDAFYLSAGFMILSIPVPIILYSLATDLTAGFNAAIPQANAGELDRLYKSISLCYDGYVASLFLAGTLFVHTMVRLLDYILVKELIK